MRINTSNFFMYIFLFLFIFFPPILAINILHILSIFIVVCSIRNYKVMLDIYIKSKLYIFTICFSIGILYLLLQSILLGSIHITDIYQLLLLSFEIPICLVYIYKFFYKKNLSIEKLIKMLIIISFIQGLFAIATYFFPTLQTFILNILVKNGLSFVNQNFIGYRSFGLATNLTSATPAFQGVICVCCMYLGLKKHIKYIALALPIAFSCIINSRTAIVIMAIGIFFLLIEIFLEHKTRLKSITKFLGLFILVVCFFNMILMPFMKEYSYSTYVWISNGIKEIFSFINGEDIGYFEVARSFIVFPEGGAFIFGSDKNIVSDIGYILNIWIGGIIYCFILYLPIVISFFRTLIHKVSTKQVMIICYLFVSMCVLEFKGSIIRQNEMMILFMLIVGWIHFFRFREETL